MLVLLIVLVFGEVFEFMWPLSFQKTHRQRKKNQQQTTAATHMKRQKQATVAVPPVVAPLSYHLQPPAVLICDSEDIFLSLTPHE